MYLREELIKTRAAVAPSDDEGRFSIIYFILRRVPKRHVARTTLLFSLDGNSFFLFFTRCYNTPPSFGAIFFYHLVEATAFARDYLFLKAFNFRIDCGTRENVKRLYIKVPLSRRKSNKIRDAGMSNCVTEYIEKLLRI